MVLGEKEILHPIALSIITNYLFVLTQLVQLNSYHVFLKEIESAKEAKLRVFVSERLFTGKYAVGVLRNIEK